MTLLNPTGRKEGEKPFDPSFGAVCNTLHFAMGVAIVFGFVAFGGSPIYGFIAVLAWAVLKDLVLWDIWMETTTWLDEIWDVAMYASGALSAMFSVMAWQRFQVG